MPNLILYLLCRFCWFRLFLSHRFSTILLAHLFDFVKACCSLFDFVPPCYNTDKPRNIDPKTEEELKLLAIVGSPRLEGNTNYLVEQALGEAAKLGAQTEKLVLSQYQVNPASGMRTVPPSTPACRRMMRAGFWTGSVRQTGLSWQPRFTGIMFQPR